MGYIPMLAQHFSHDPISQDKLSIKPFKGLGKVRLLFVVGHVSELFRKIQGTADCGVEAFRDRRYASQGPANRES